MKGRRVKSASRRSSSTSTTLKQTTSPQCFSTLTTVKTRSTSRQPTYTTHKSYVVSQKAKSTPSISQKTYSTSSMNLEQPLPHNHLINTNNSRKLLSKSQLLQPQCSNIAPDRLAHTKLHSNQSITRLRHHGSPSITTHMSRSPPVVPLKPRSNIDPPNQNMIKHNPTRHDSGSDLFIAKNSIMEYTQRCSAAPFAFTPSMMTLSIVKPVRRSSTSKPAPTERPIIDASDLGIDFSEEKVEPTPPDVVVDTSQLTYRQIGTAYLLKALNDKVWAASVYALMYAATFAFAYALSAYGGLRETLVDLINQISYLESFATKIRENPQSADLILAYLFTSSTDWVRLPILFALAKKRFHSDTVPLSLPQVEYDMVLNKASMRDVIKYKINSTGFAAKVKEHQAQQQQAEKMAAFEKRAKMADETHHEDTAEAVKTNPLDHQRSHKPEQEDAPQEPQQNQQQQQQQQQTAVHSTTDKKQ